MVPPKNIFCTRNAQQGCKPFSLIACHLSATRAQAVNATPILFSVLPVNQIDLFNQFLLKERLYRAV
jgi:hypothetical protein